MTERAFADAAVESAQAFRCIMDAVARPGRITPFASAIEAPAPLWNTAAAVALTLCDYQTRLWLAPALRSEAVKHYLRFHSGAPIVDAPADAAFAFIDADGDVPDLSLFAQGSHEYPDRSATLVLLVKELSSDGPVCLSGPGIPQPLQFGARGLGPEFWSAMAENHAQFPIGVDVIFVSPSAIAACPRSTAIRMLETA